VLWFIILIGIFLTNILDVIDPTSPHPGLHQVKKHQLSSAKWLIGLRFLTLSCYLMKEIELIYGVVFLTN
jgi:hypothetical protein